MNRKSFVLPVIVIVLATILADTAYQKDSARKKDPVH